MTVILIRLQVYKSGLYYTNDDNNNNDNDNQV